MNPAQRYFLAALAGTFRPETAELREQVAKLQGDVIDLRDFGVDLAWSKIEKAAEIVEKSGAPLSEAQAVARVLRKRPELYTDYLAATASRHDSIEKSAAATGQRHLAESAEERLAGIVRKGIDLGLSEDEAVDMAIQRHPDLVAQCGSEVPVEVEKGAAVVHEIDRAARALMSRDPSLSIERATDQVLRAQPELYSRYVEEIRSGDQAGASSKVTKAGGALVEIERATRREMQRDRSLSHAQAMARALARNPALYTAYLAEAAGDSDDEAEEPWPPTSGSAASKSPLDGLKPRQPVAKAALGSQDGRWSATVDEDDAAAVAWWQRLWAGNARIAKEMAQ